MFWRSTGIKITENAECPFWNAAQHGHAKIPLIFLDYHNTINNLIPKKYRNKNYKSPELPKTTYVGKKQFNSLINYF